MTPLIRKPQIARPKKRINVQVDDNGLIVQLTRPLTNFDIDLRGLKRRLRVKGEEKSESDDES